MSNNQIITAWKNGERKGREGRRLNTDGDNLYSYELCIGQTDEDGNKVLFVSTAKNGCYYSGTTSRHCELVRREGVDIIHEMDITKYEELEELRREIPIIIAEQTPIIPDIANLIVGYVC